MREEYSITVSKVSFIKQTRVFSKLEIGKVKYCVYVEGLTPNGCRISFFSKSCILKESGIGNYVIFDNSEFIIQSHDFTEPYFRINTRECVRPLLQRGDSITVIGSIKSFSVNHTRLVRVNIINNGKVDNNP